MFAPFAIALTLFSTAALLGRAATLPTHLHARADFNPSFPYGTEKVRGVNLGGWLVLEPWLTPSLFDATGNDAIIDEYTFGQYQDKHTAKAALKKHWDTWITEDDFAQIASVGLNHVRLPIGYWAWDVSGGEPFIQGQLPYLRKAIRWARKYNLKVVIDLHGAPGSQNGFDNSGQKLPFPTWQDKQKNIDRTNAVIAAITAEFGFQSDVASVIAPLNEPAGFDGELILNVTKQYWRDSYATIRTIPSDNVVLIHDAFQSLDYWNGFASGTQGMALDTHIYEVFDNALLARSTSEHIAALCGRGSDISNFVASQNLWVVVGEWTPAMTDCAKYLNGRGVGARFDGTYNTSIPAIGSCEGKTGIGSSFSDEYKAELRKTWEAQVISYERGSGWIQWTWKTEVGDDWSYKAGIDNGWIPRDPTDLQHPGICNSV